MASADISRCAFVLVLAVASSTLAFPRIRMTRQAPEESLGLPSNATAIRSDISDSFSCDSRIYGYYADVDNDCQLFHVCLPVQFADGREEMLKWSFICPEETVFNQESFTCTRPEDALACEESPQYYSLNEGFGVTEQALPGDQNTLEALAVAVGFSTSRWHMNPTSCSVAIYTDEKLIFLQNDSPPRKTAPEVFVPFTMQTPGQRMAGAVLPSCILLIRFLSQSR